METEKVPKQYKFFDDSIWAKYHQTKDEQWKWLALKKIGSKMTIPERRFLGYSPEVEKIITDIIKDNIEQFAKETIEKMKK